MAKWDRFAINAEIKRRGTTLRAISLEAGLGESTTRAALFKPSPAANRAISEYLDIPLHVLWPAWYRPDGSRRLDRASSRNPTPQTA